MKVLLIHGLARTSLSLLTLEWRLKAEGYDVEHFGYFAFSESFDQIAKRLWGQLRHLSQQGPYSVVAHSLGGLLTRAALGMGQVDWPHHIVMLGTPNQMPRLAAHAWKLLPFRWFTGQCGQNLTQLAFFKDLPAVETPYTIIAGTAGPTGLLSPFGDEVNDGIVALSETRLTDGDRIITLPVWHTFMMNHGMVQTAVLEAIEG